MDFDRTTYRFTNSANTGRRYLMVGVAGLVLSVFGYFISREQFFYSYLTAFVFWFTIGLGGLLFVMIHYLTNATWSVVLRRIGENIMSVVPMMAIFAIPVILGAGSIYEWSHSSVVHADHILEGKTSYLNVPFFIIRLLIYAAIWIFLSSYLMKLSLRQDVEHTEMFTRSAIKTSAIGTILFAVTLTFFSFDLLMSLEPHWYSTIFGAYIFAGSFLGMLAFMTFNVIKIRDRAALEETITLEHFHDLGKLMFTFVIFWGYMAFSQYLVIWYGNIPEETVWFLERWEGSWKIMSLVIVFGHFVVPFFILFPMAAKRSRSIMTFICLWILLMHWVDIYWVVMPSLHHYGVHLSWMDLTTTAGIGGFFIWRFQRLLYSRPVVPLNDPRLKNSIRIVS